MLLVLINSQNYKFVFLVLINPENTAQLYTSSAVTAVRYISGLPLLVISGRLIITDAIFTGILPVVTCKARNSRVNSGNYAEII